MYLIIPPKKATSLPARIATHLSDVADVRVKRGSTWMILAPLVSRATKAHFQPQG